MKKDFSTKKLLEEIIDETVSNVFSEEFIGTKGRVKYYQMGRSLPDALYNLDSKGKPARDPGVAGIKKRRPSRRKKNEAILRLLGEFILTEAETKTFRPTALGKLSQTASAQSDFSREDPIANKIAGLVSGVESGNRDAMWEMAAEFNKIARMRSQSQQGVVKTEETSASRVGKLYEYIYSLFEKHGLLEKVQDVKVLPLKGLNTHVGNLPLPPSPESSLELKEELKKKIRIFANQLVNDIKLYKADRDDFIENYATYYQNFQIEKSFRAISQAAQNFIKSKKEPQKSAEVQKKSMPSVFKDFGEDYTTFATNVQKNRDDIEKMIKDIANTLGSDKKSIKSYFVNTLNQALGKKKTDINAEFIDALKAGQGKEAPLSDRVDTVVKALEKSLSALPKAKTDAGKKAIQDLMTTVSSKLAAPAKSPKVFKRPTTESRIFNHLFEVNSTNNAFACAILLFALSD
jgi:hypothetical protein